MYSCETCGIRVDVEPHFMDDHSSHEEGHYVWAYRVRIANEGSQAVKLLSRHWRITDGIGRTTEVRGTGVVGEQPVLQPGEAFEYTSGTPLSTPSGIMVGSYGLETDGGEHIEVAIPAFSLDSPYEMIRLN